MGLFRTSAATFVIKGCELVAATLAAMLLNHFMKVEERGLFTMLMLVPTMFFSISSLSLQVVTVREIGSKTHPLGVYAGTLMVLSLLTILLYFGLYFGASALGWIKTMTVDDKSLVLLAVLIGPFMLITNHLGGLLQGTMNIKWFNIVMTFHRFVNLLLIAAAVLFGFLTIRNVLIINVVGVGLAGAMGVYYLLRISHPSQWRLSRSAASTLLRHGFVFHIGAIAWFFCGRNGIMMLKYYHGDTAVGYLAVALMIAESFLVLFSTAWTVLLPAVSERSYEEACQLAGDAARMFMIVAFGAAFLAAIVSPAIIYIYGGRKYFPSIIPMVILVFGQCFSLGQSITGLLVFHKKWYAYWTGVTLGALAVSIGLNWLFIPAYGVIGAAVAMATTNVLQFIYTCAALSPLLDCSPREFFVPRRADVKALGGHLRTTLHEIRGKPQ